MRIYLPTDDISLGTYDKPYGYDIPATFDWDMNYMRGKIDPEQRLEKKPNFDEEEEELWKFLLEGPNLKDEIDSEPNLATTTDLVAELHDLTQTFKPWDDHLVEQRIVTDVEDETTKTINKAKAEIKERNLQKTEEERQEEEAWEKSWVWEFHLQHNTKLFQIEGYEGPTMTAMEYNREVARILPYKPFDLSELLSNIAVKKEIGKGEEQVERADENEQTQQGPDPEPNENDGGKNGDETSFLDREVKRKVSKTDLNVYNEFDYVRAQVDITSEECKCQQNTELGHITCNSKEYIKCNVHNKYIPLSEYLASKYFGMNEMGDKNQMENSLNYDVKIDAEVIYEKQKYIDEEWSHLRNQGVINIADTVKYMKDGTFDLNVHPNTKESHQADEKEVGEEKKVKENCCNGVLRDELEEKISDKDVKNEVKEKSTDDKAKDMQDRLKDKSVGSGSAFISAYKMYLSHFGFLNIILVLVLYVFNQGLITGSSIWLTYWSDQSEKGAFIQKNITVPVTSEFGRNASENVIVPFNNEFYIGVYGAIGIATSVCAFLRNLLLFVSAAGASKSIHSRLFKSVIKGQLAFFESSSSGSVVSRFSSDMDATDSMIPNQISAFLFNTFEVLAVIVTISYSSPESLIAGILIVFISYGIKTSYIKTSKQLKRLESSSNSPIYAHFNETIRGISSIKAFDEFPRFVQEFGHLISTNLRFSYNSVMCGRWLNLRTEMVAQTLVLAASLVAVIHRDSFSSGWAGLIISLALSVTETFNWVLICLTNLEDQATVVQRIKELTKHIPQEKNWTSEKPPPKSWPSRGVIEFENYSTGYSSDVDVLKKLVFKSESGEKLAIVGRTGAGKSSMVLACLRILEAKEGRILIDDVDISKIGLHKDHFPVLPTCFQHAFISLIPIVFVIFGFIQGFNITRRKKLKFRKLRSITNIRLSVIGGLIISQLCVLVQGSQIELIQQISAGIILAFLIVLAMTVFCQDLSQTVSIPAAFYFWILFLFSRAPLVPLIHIDSSLNEVDRISHFVSFILGIFGFVLEWFPLKFEGQHATTPEEKSSHISILFYGWLDPLSWKGLKELLTKEKVPGLQRDMTVNRVLEKFGKRKPMDPSVKFEGVAFSAAANKDDVFVEIGDLNRIEKNEKVVKTLAKTFGETFFAAAFMKLIQDLLKFVVPIILKDLIKFVKDSNSDSTCESSPWVGYFYAISIFIIGIVNSVLLQAYWKETHSVALRVRTSLFSDIYAKSLTLNPTSRKEYTVGEIVTLMSTDAQTFKQVIPSLNMVWSMPLQIVLAIYFLYHELGPSVFGGVVVLVLLVPFNTFMGKKSQAVNREQLKSKDKRVRRIYELLNSLKIVKLYAWENLFDKRVQECRDTEIKFLKKNAILKAMINFVFGSAPILVTLVSFAIYVSVDAEKGLTPEKAFVCLTLSSMLRLPINLLPNILTEILRLNVSIKRVNKFLSCENITKYVEILNPTTNHDVDIDIENGEFAWNDGPTFLHNINFSVKTGTLYAIAGPTGSGKSSLLAAILGQMTHKGGKIGTASKRMAYVSQEAWIQNKTIKENILFGRPMDPSLYRKVIQSRALKDNFWIPPEGDSTMIGENGVNLSGGQKQRISLARAVYSNADIYLLDDCLSAVDVHVGSHLTECVLGRQGILAGKTRVMVTHMCSRKQLNQGFNFSGTLRGHDWRMDSFIFAFIISCVFYLIFFRRSV